MTTYWVRTVTATTTSLTHCIQGSNIGHCRLTIVTVLTTIQWHNNTMGISISENLQAVKTAISALTLPSGQPTSPFSRQERYSTTPALLCPTRLSFEGLSDTSSFHSIRDGYRARRYTQQAPVKRWSRGRSGSHSQQRRSCPAKLTSLPDGR